MKAEKAYFTTFLYIQTKYQEFCSKDRQTQKSKTQKFTIITQVVIQHTHTHTYCLFIIITLIVVLYNDGSCGKLTECEIYKNSSQGIYIRDKVTVTIERCIIRNNKDSGITCHSKVRGTIKGNKIVSNIGGITYRTDDQEPFEDNDIDPNNETVPKEIVRCLEKGVCTYTVTQNVYFNQHYYFCDDCDPTHDLCFCVPCSKRCHVGHKLSKVKFGGFYCDCYKMNCKCRTSKRAQELEQEK